MYRVCCSGFQFFIMLTLHHTFSRAFCFLTLHNYHYAMKNHMNTCPNGWATHSGGHGTLLHASTMDGLGSEQSLESTSYSIPSAATCMHFISRVLFPPLQVWEQSSQPSGFQLRWKVDKIVLPSESANINYFELITFGVKQRLSGSKSKIYISLVFKIHALLISFQN